LSQFENRWGGGHLDNEDGVLMFCSQVCED